MQENQNPEQQINIELTEEMADGQYVNLALISGSPTEFVLDFINVVPNMPKAKVKSRVIMHPVHAKRLMRALVETVKRYEAANGTIKDGEQVNMPFTFGGPTAQA